ncbi:MAG TPA: HEPN domain-containing protein [Syntrophaceae bacterium]|nr:HEPN domain-containing protein [Syntrophaceae bacterium]
MDQVLEKKYKSIEEFQKALLDSQVKGKIAKIVLFGSVLRGDAREDSDIDLMIIATDSTEEVERVCSEISYQVMLDTGELIMPIVHPVEEVFLPRSYFFYYNHRIGREIYKMEHDEIKLREIGSYLELAKEYLEGGKRCSDNMDYRIAVDAAYNAAELSAKGLLLLKIDNLPSSHGGILAKFGELYVKTGEIQRELGRRTNEALELRHKARYRGDVTIAENDALKVIDLAQQLINLLSELQREHLT